jgi:hypothetical protein
MRDLFEREWTWIDRLVAASADNGVSADHFLARNVFSEKAGRALIRQPAGQFGYFYLRKDVFDDESRRRSEPRSMLDLVENIGSWTWGMLI